MRRRRSSASISLRSPAEALERSPGQPNHSPPDSSCGPRSAVARPPEEGASRTRPRSSRSVTGSRFETMRSRPRRAEPPYFDFGVGRDAGRGSSFPPRGAQMPRQTPSAQVSPLGQSRARLQWRSQRPLLQRLPSPQPESSRHSTQCDCVQYPKRGSTSLQSPAFEQGTVFGWRSHPPQASPSVASTRQHKRARMERDVIDPSGGEEVWRRRAHLGFRCHSTVRAAVAATPRRLARFCPG